MKSMARIAILGFGKEGRAVLSFLLADARYVEACITILTKTEDEQATGAAAGQERVSYFFGPDYLASLAEFDMIVRSPGIPYFTPEIQAAAGAGAVVTSGTKLFFEEMRDCRSEEPICKGKIIGITGTKGKGTVATLLEQMLRAAGRSTVLVGNIGEPALNKLAEAKDADFAVFELSSFQLQDLTTSPDVAVILDITPDHLDVHESVKEYVQAKTAITAFQTDHDSVFYFPGNKYVKSIIKTTDAKQIEVDPERFDLFKPEELRVPGKHTYANAVMAAEVACRLGVPEMVVRKAALEFSGLPHRLERVRAVSYEIGDKSYEIVFYNDSAATNPESAAAAIRSFTDPVILIAGGIAKVPDYKPLAKSLKKSSVEKVLLIGRDREKIAHAVRRKWKGEIEFVDNLAKAVKLAVTAAQSTHYELSTRHSVIILFSPASASFDMFKNAYDRGDQFRDIVKNLKV